MKYHIQINTSDGKFYELSSNTEDLWEAVRKAVDSRANWWLFEKFAFNINHIVSVHTY